MTRVQHCDVELYSVTVPAIAPEELPLGELETIHNTGVLGGAGGAVEVVLTGTKPVLRAYLDAHWGDGEAESYPELADDAPRPLTAEQTRAMFEAADEARADRNARLNAMQQGSVPRDITD